MSYRIVASFSTAIGELEHTRCVKFMKMEEVISPVSEEKVNILREVQQEEGDIPLEGYEMYSPVDKNQYLRRIKMGFEEVDTVDDCYVWRIPWSLYYPTMNIWVPVIDCNFPIEGEFRYRIKGDTREAYEARVASHRRMREDTLRVLSAPPYRVNRMSWSLRSFLRQPLSQLAQPQPQPRVAAPAFVAEIMKKDAIKEGRACPILLDVFSEVGAMSMTPCFHIFNTESLKVWVEKQASCPVCKAAVELEDCV